MNKDRELKRLEELILKMRDRIIDLHKYNRVIKSLNSISDDKSFEAVLKILCEGFMVDGCSLMVLGRNGLETIAFNGTHQVFQILVGKGALFFASTTITDGRPQTMSTEMGVFLSLPIIKGDPLGVLNLYRSKHQAHKSEPQTFLEVSFSERDQKIFFDIANQIGVSLERIFLGQNKI